MIDHVQNRLSEEMPSVFGTYRAGNRPTKYRQPNSVNGFEERHADQVKAIR